VPGTWPFKEEQVLRSGPWSSTFQLGLVYQKVSSSSCLEYSDTVECEQERMLRVPAWGSEAEEFEGCPIFVGALMGNFFSGLAVLSF